LAKHAAVKNNNEEGQTTQWPKEKEQKDKNRV
jgi:hypothetical protein